jgi:hypothetical protein
VEIPDDVIVAGLRVQAKLDVGETVLLRVTVPVKVGA